MFTFFIGLINKQLKFFEISYDILLALITGFLTSYSVTLHFENKTRNNKYFDITSEVIYSLGKLNHLIDKDPKKTENNLTQILEVIREDIRKLNKLEIYFQTNNFDDNYIKKINKAKENLENLGRTIKSDPLKNQNFLMYSLIARTNIYQNLAEVQGFLIEYNNYKRIE